VQEVRGAVSRVHADLPQLWRAEMSFQDKTALLYLPDIGSCYLREFRAKVLNNSERGVVLDRTVFHPQGGGQPSDRGFLFHRDMPFQVSSVTKNGGVIHHIDGWLPDNVTEVEGHIDWTWRYPIMRMHTAQHLVSGVALELFDADTMGERISPEESRVDIALQGLDQGMLERLEDRCNQLISHRLSVDICFEEREKLISSQERQRINIELVPRSVQMLRLVRIRGFDETPCAGTHVMNLKEIGMIHCTRCKRKKGGVTSVYYQLTKH